jgi:hypothetical protein
MRDFRNLQVWEKAHNLTLDVYKATGSFPVEYQLLLAHDLDYLSQDVYTEFHEKVTEVKRMLAGFIKKLKN